MPTSQKIEPAAVLAEFADGWTKALDSLSPRQVREIEKWAAEFERRVEGGITAQLVVGIAVGAGLTQDLSAPPAPLASVLAMLHPAGSLGVGLVPLLAACLAHRILDGDSPTEN